MAPRTDELLTTADVMRRLRIKRALLDNLIAEGFPVIRLGPRTFRYDPAAVDAWLNAHSRWNEPTAGDTDTENVA